MRYVCVTFCRFCPILLILCVLINIVGCLPTEQWSVSSDGRLAIPTSEGLFIFNPITLDGKNLYITGADSDLSPRRAAWSGDDKLIACIMYGSLADGPDVQEQGTWEVWLFDATSKKFKPIYKSNQTLQFLSWFPSGRYVFVAEQEVKPDEKTLFSTYRLIAIDVKSLDVSEFLKGTAGIHAWSPDGRQIAYFVMQEALRADIFTGAVGVYDFISKQAKYHIYGVCQPGDAMVGWSPDASSLLFSGITAGTTPESIPTAAELTAREKVSFLYIYDLNNGTISKLREQPAVYGIWNRQGTGFLATEVPLKDMASQSSIMAITGTGLMPGKNLVVKQHGKEFVAATDVTYTPSKPIWVSDHHILYHKNTKNGDSAKQTGMFLLDTLSANSRDMTSNWQQFHLNQIASRKKDLIKSLDSGSIQMAYRACMTLKKMGGDEIAAEAKRRLKSDPCTAVRVACVDLFVAVAEKQAIPVLVDLLKDPEKRVRSRCIWQLGNLKATGASFLLQDILQRETDPDICEQIVISLKGIGDPSAIPAIRKAMVRAPVDKLDAYQQALKQLHEQASKMEREKPNTTQRPKL